MLPPNIVLDPIIAEWLREDIGRGDRATAGLFPLDSPSGAAVWIAKASGTISGLPIAKRTFELLDTSTASTTFRALVTDGDRVSPGQKIAEIEGKLATLLTGERVALNLVMRLSGIATLTRQYVDAIAHTSSHNSVRLVDTRKTTPGLRLFEKYATQVGGAVNHRFGLDDAAMLKDNHIAAAGSITEAVSRVRRSMPFTTTIEVETATIEQVKEAMQLDVDIIMLDNMTLELMRESIDLIRTHQPKIKIEASGNITLETISSVAALGMDYISTSAMVTRSPWLDLSMNIISP